MTMTEIPADFPLHHPLAALSGTNPKVAAVKVGDRYVSDGDPVATAARYEICEDLVQQLTGYRARKAAEHPEWSADELSTKIEVGLRQKASGWGLSADETAWIARRLACSQHTPGG